MTAHRRSLGSLFRRTRNGKPEARWSISYRVDGKRITERAYTDKRASDEMLAQRLREVARGEVAAGAPPRRQRTTSAPPAPAGDARLAAIAALSSRDPARQQLGAAALAYLVADGARLEAGELALVATVANAAADRTTWRALAAVLKAHKAPAPRAWAWA